MITAIQRDRLWRHLAAFPGSGALQIAAATETPAGDVWGEMERLEAAGLAQRSRTGNGPWTWQQVAT